MPILPAQADLFPENLLDEPCAATGQRKWWLLYTLSRREKELMRRLAAAEVGFYSPLIKKSTRSPNGRARSSYVPLFAGYVFLCADEEERRTALATNCVSRSTPIDDAARLVADLARIRRLLELGAPVLPEARLEAGRRVRIKSGSFAGLEGTVVRRHGQQRLLVAVEFLQQGASIQIEDFVLEPLD